MSNWVQIKNEKDTERAVNLDLVVSAEFISGEEKGQEDHFRCQSAGFKEFELPLGALRIIFEKVAAQNDVYRLDGEYSYDEHRKASYLFKLDDIDYIISSEINPKDGMRGVIIVGNSTFIDGLSVSQGAYDDLIEQWRTVKDGHEVLIRPDEAAARFVKPYETYIDPRRITCIQQYDRSAQVNVYFDKGNIDFNVDDQSYLIPAWHVMAEAAQEGRPKSQEEKNAIIDEYMNISANDFTTGILGLAPQLAQLQSKQGVFCFDLSKAVTVSKLNDGFVISTSFERRGRDEYRAYLGAQNIDAIYDDVISKFTNKAVSLSAPKPK